MRIHPRHHLLNGKSTCGGGSEVAKTLFTFVFPAVSGRPSRTHAPRNETEAHPKEETLMPWPFKQTRISGTFGMALPLASAGFTVLQVGFHAARHTELLPPRPCRSQAAVRRSQSKRDTSMNRLPSHVLGLNSSLAACGSVTSCTRIEHAKECEQVGRQDVSVAHVASVTLK